MLTLSIREVFTDGELTDYHYQLKGWGLEASGALYEVPAELKPPAVLLLAIKALNGLTRSAGGGEEENPDLRETEKAPTSNHSSSGAASAGA